MMQIGRKARLFCLLVRYSAHFMSHDVTLRNCICMIEHFIWDLAEEPPGGQTGKNSETGFHAISRNFD